MAKLVLTDISNIDTSADDLNANFAAIEAALENTVSRDGTLPNHMLANLDMSGNLVLNSGNLTTTEDRILDYVDPRDWNGYDGTGNNANASVLQAACDQGHTSKLPVRIPNSKYGMLIEETVTTRVPFFSNISASTSYPYSYGLNPSGQARLISGVSGSDAYGPKPVIQVYPHIHGWTGRDFIIGVYGNGISNSSYQECTGIRMGTPGANPLAGGFGSANSFCSLNNISTHGMEMGYDIQGWCMTFHGLKAAMCETAYRGEWNNSSVLDLQAQDCDTGLTLTNSIGMNILRLMEEGSSSYRTTSSSINTCNSIQIGFYYSESEDPSTSTVPWLKVGDVDYVTDFRIHSGRLGSMADGYWPLELGKVRGYSINLMHGDVYDGSLATQILSRYNYKTTTDTRFGYDPIILNIAHVTDFIGDTDRYFNVGDTIKYADPTASTYAGLLCVTAGAGGTATWSRYGATTSASATPTIP